MNKKVIIARIKMALLSAEIAGVQTMSHDISPDEADQMVDKQAKSLYEFIAAVEPKHESEVV